MVTQFRVRREHRLSEKDPFFMGNSGAVNFDATFVAGFRYLERGWTGVATCSAPSHDQENARSEPKTTDPCRRRFILTSATSIVGFDRVSAKIHRDLCEIARVQYFCV